MKEWKDLPVFLSSLPRSLTHSDVLTLLGIILFVFLLFCFILGELDQLGCVPVVVTIIVLIVLGRLGFFCLFGGGGVIRKGNQGWWMEILRIPFC